MKRGYFGIGVQNIKKEVNLGTLFRSAHCLGASFIFNIGNRYVVQSSDTTKAYKHIPFYNYKDTEEFLNNRPKDCQLIGVEINENSRDIKNYIHPERAIYILGPEDGSLSPKIIEKCQSLIKIDSKFCLNVSTAASIIMFDRNNK